MQAHRAARDAYFDNIAIHQFLLGVGLAHWTSFLTQPAIVPFPFGLPMSPVLFLAIIPSLSLPMFHFLSLLKACHASANIVLFFCAGSEDSH